MVKRRVVPAILGLIAESKVPWSTAKFHGLSQYAMTTLAILAPKMPQEFLSSNGTLRYPSDLFFEGVNNEIDKS